jgi:hypothetical protein
MRNETGVLAVRLNRRTLSLELNNTAESQKEHARKKLCGRRPPSDAHIADSEFHKEIAT